MPPILGLAHSIALATVLVGIVSPAPVMACACCSEPGQRLDRSDAVSSSIVDEIHHIRLAQATALYADAGFPETVKGVAKPVQGEFRVAANLGGNRVTFELIDSANRSGRIAFALPATFRRFEVDTRVEDARSPGGGPVLYKEWRMEVLAELGGIFAAASQRARATWILHGRGNSCTSSSDFTHWTLSVTGPGVNFALLGSMEP